MEFAHQLLNSVIVFEDMNGIRDAIQYAFYLNYHLHSSQAAIETDDEKMRQALLREALE